MTIKAKDWNIDHIRYHIRNTLPLSEHFGLEIEEVNREKCILSISKTDFSLRSGGGVAGPILFAAADVASYALIISARHDPNAVTVNNNINFLRRAATLPLFAQTTFLRIGQKLATTETRIFADEALSHLIATAISTWAFS